MSALKIVIRLKVLLIILIFGVALLVLKNTVNAHTDGGQVHLDCSGTDPQTGTPYPPGQNEHWTCQAPCTAPTTCGTTRGCICPNPTTAPPNTPTPTPVPSAPTPSPIPSCPDPTKGCNINTSNYKAPQNANYTILNLEHSISCEIIGASIAGGQNCITYDGKTPKLYSMLPHGGAVGGLNSVMVAMYNNPPTSTTLYLANALENMGVAPKTAYAQSVTGKGQGVLRPILELWKLTRNVAYLSFTLIFVVVGLMIMFRHRINAQTVVTAQMALPGLILGLILVTFSYFIASLIVDLAFVGMKVVASLFLLSGASGVPTNANQLAEAPIWALFGNFVARNWLEPVKIFAGLFHLSPEMSQALGSGLLAAPTGMTSLVWGNIPGFGAKISQWVGNLAAQGVGGFIGGLLSIVIIIALAVQMVRLVWKLIQGYIGILVATIIGPLIILQSSIPGRGPTLSNWWKGLLANVLVFPAVFAAFLFSAVLVGGDASTFKEGDPLPLFTGIPAELLRLILGYGVIIMIPAIPDQVKAAFGIKGGGLGAAAGAEAATAVGAIGAGYKQGMQTSGLAAAKKTLADQDTATRVGTTAAPGGGTMTPWLRNVLRRLPGV